MLQTIEIPNYEWLSGNINNILYDLEENECTIKDIKILYTKEFKVYQILFTCNDVITWKTVLNGVFPALKSKLVIYNSCGEIILEYSEASLW